MFFREVRELFSLTKKQTNSIIKITIMKITNAVILFIAAISSNAEAKIKGSEEETSRKLRTHGRSQERFYMSGPRQTYYNDRNREGPQDRFYMSGPQQPYYDGRNREGPRQRDFRADLTPNVNSVQGSWCGTRSPARGELDPSSRRFCVNVSNLFFRPTDATVRGGENFTNKKIDCSRGTECRSCYNFSRQEVSQLTRGELRVVVQNTNNEVCRISGDLRQGY